MKIKTLSLRKLPVSRDFLIKQLQQPTYQEIQNKLQRNKSDNSVSQKIQALLQREDKLKHQQIIQPQEQFIQGQKLPLKNDHKSYQLNNNNSDHNNFHKLYADHINFIVSKNPEYFEHLSGKCKCFKSNFLERCKGMDQNQYKKSSKIGSTYGNDFVRARSNIDPRAAQLKSDPHQSSFYDFGTKKYFMHQQTISNMEFNNKLFPKSTITSKRIKKNQIEQTEANKEPMIYTRSHYDQEYQGLICPPVIPYHKLIHNDNHLERKNPFKFTSKSIYGTSYYNWKDRFIPNPVYDKTKLLGIFSTSMPFQARSSTKMAYSQEHAQIKEVEKPIRYEHKPQALPSFKRQFISTASGDFGRIGLFKQNMNQNGEKSESKEHIIDQIKLQLQNIQNFGEFQ